MLLCYHQDPLGNFGDDLNPWLWERLLPGWFSGHVTNVPTRWPTGAIGEPLFIGIGTLLNDKVPEAPLRIVFGSGVGYGPLPKLDASWEIYCVRGPDSADALGLDRRFAVTDPAALVRVLPLPEPCARWRTAYMPHCSSVRSADWRAICDDLRIGFVDPQDPVDTVLAALRSTDMLVTEAMHGAIVADALRIPWIAVTSSPVILESKWVDWCKSLGIDYNPVRLPMIWKAKPGRGAIARLWPVVKTSLVKMALKRVVAVGRPVLSAPDRLGRATDELQAQLEAFRRRHLRGEHTSG